MAGSSIADALYLALAAHYGQSPEVPRSKGFGSGALKVDGKIFAALSKGRLLLKLPKARVDALIEAGQGERFSTGPGREKKEWVTVPPTTQDEWQALAAEARAFVSGAK